MAGCGDIVSNIAFDCNDKSVLGTVQNFILLNYDDIDRARSTVDRTASTHKVTSLKLKDGKTGYLIQGSPAKKHQGWNSKININDDELDDYTHGINMRVYGMTESTLAWLNNVGKGANLVAVFENKAVGALGVDKYTVVGWDAGLKISEMNLGSIENQSSTPIVLNSRYDMEGHVPMKYLDTDVATSDTAFQALFV